MSGQSGVSVAHWTTAKKVALLRALWENQRPAAFFSCFAAMSAGMGGGPQFDAAQAQHAVNSNIDYFCGRAFKIDARKDTWHLGLYDRDVPSGNPTGAEIYARIASQ